MGAAESYMRLALRAQNQCQATLRTLGEIKSPKNVAFVKQANIAKNQQVNNNATPPPESDLIESIHDGSFFHDSLKLWVFLPSGIILAILWVTGVYLFLLPYLLRHRKRKLGHL